MMDYTDRHERYFLRLISKNVLLYTEMLTTQALLNGDPQRLLRYHASEHPIALQLGGSNADELAVCAQLAEQAGYDEVNLNVGCPSDRVKAGKFGACLMAEADLLAQCFTVMQSKVSIPVTIKCRIGIDEQDEAQTLPVFIKTLADAGCSIFVIHARKAWLKGLSPKENRAIPPLNYPLVYDIKREFEGLTISLNGGVQTIQAAEQHLQHVDGVMIGRAAYHNPYILAQADQILYGSKVKPRTRKQILSHYLPYIEQQLEEGVRLSQISRHILGLFHGLPGARQWRRYLSENANKPQAGCVVIKTAASYVQE
ncbi:MAG TPA: tRNA dihydrouridine(20/20a) synthase DusA [Gammaproteobacteria bacterium]|nr:tRNA dihydrouridine(20/20a) synthase DusA [Gammaproteobacteria bacterium]